VLLTKKKPNKNMNYAQKLDELRKTIEKQGLDGFIVPRTDEYQGEYVPECAERLAWITGFTGSAGIAVVLADRAVVMSDGRYTIQLEKQIDGALYALANSQEVKLEEWIAENATDGGVIGYDPKLHTAMQVEELQKAGVDLRAVDHNLMDIIWEDQPKAPRGSVELFSEEFAGVSAREKIKNIQKKLKKDDANAVVLTMSDSIAWLLNIRGSDISYIPVALSYAIVPMSGKVQWFIDVNKITDEVRESLGDIVEFQAEENIEHVLKSLEHKICYDPKRSSVWFRNILEGTGVDVLERNDPCILPRSCKNKFEQEAMKQAHIRDGVALVKFLKWFDEEAIKEELTELSVERKLENFRAEAPEFKEPSFNTIAGYGAHGAIVHYRANEQSNEVIKRDNLLLLDSGAQYVDGTTDITRTIAIGTPTAEMQERNTLVLKGHIALASAKFSKGTTGKQLDVLARGFLQEQGLDYAHGTGHGVGCYLSVHEEAAGISPRGEQALQAGMIISNEPGYYKENEYGIRIENLLQTLEASDDDLYFETITLAPIDKNLIVKDMLSDEEVEWLNQYHARVFKALSSLLDSDVKEWLKKSTNKI
jgi:Xaa-Pro aminopeptidase